MAYPVLFSLALLKIHWDSNKTIFLDNFIPFAVEAIKEQREDLVSVQELQETLNDLFGLCIPQNVIKALLYRARKKGYVKLENHIFYKVKDKLESFVFSSLQNKVQRIYSALIDDFVAWTKNKYNISLGGEEAEQLLLSFISHNQLTIYQFNPEDKIIQDTAKPEADKKFIVADYIYEAKQSRPEAYDYLDTVVKGYMIANTLYLPDVYETGRKFRKTKVFLDTSFIMYALGYSGEEYKLPCLELLDLLYKNNAVICCFRHTVDEIKGILDACSNVINQAKYTDSPFGRSIQYFRSRGDKSSDVRLLIPRLEKNIERLRISIFDAPDYSQHPYVMDETGFTTLLKESMPHAHANGTIERDVASISAIYRLRKNNYSYSLEESPAFFVTTNNTLTTTSNDFFYRNNERNIAPPCITDFILTNLLWLKTPNQAPNLPMRRIIADSFAAIQPDESLMAKWLTEIDRLQKGDPVAEEDYYFMRSSDEVRVALMESTLGIPDAITTGTAAQIIEKAKDKIRKEVESQLTGEVKKSNETVAIYSEQLAAGRRKEAERYDRLHTRAHVIAKNIMQVFRALSILILLFLVTVSLPWGLLINDQALGDWVNQWPRFMPASAVVLLGILVFGSFYNGTTLNSILNSAEISLDEKVFEFLDSLAN